MQALFVLVVAFAFGAIVGSFLNVVILRVPREESIVFPGSHCLSCGQPIRWYDNVPIASYLLLRGRCRDCGARFSPRYMLIEALSGALAVLCAGVPVLGTNVWRPEVNLPYFVLIAALIVVTFIDIDHQIIPDRISLGGIAPGVAVAALLSPVGLKSSLLGLLVGGGSLLLVALGYWLFTRKQGMGMGDVKLMAMLGAWLGLASIPFILVTGSLIGAAVGVAVLLRGKAGLKAKLPFGPFLAGAAVLYLFVGVQIAGMYVGLFDGGGR